MSVGIIDHHTPLGVSAVVLSINAGAIFEVPGLRGVSHLVEHVACESYKHMESTLSRLAIDDNACTGTDHVQFFVRGLTKNIDRVFEEWLNCLLTYVPTEAVFNQELAIVKQEYDDMLGSQTGGLYVNALRRHFNFSPSYGVRADLENLDFDTFSRFYGQLMGDLRSVLFVRGSGSQGIPGELYNVLRAKNFRHARPTFDPEVKDLPLECGSSSANASIFDLLPLPVSVKPWEADFVGVLLSQGLGSPVLKRLREDLGYVYSVRMDAYTHVGHTGAMGLWTSTKPENVDGLRAEFQKLLAPETITESRFAEIIERKGYDLEARNMFRTKREYTDSIVEDQDFVIDLEKLAGFTYSRAQEILAALRSTEVRKSDFSSELRIHPLSDA